MSRDVECPYCGKYQEICHDDGAGYSEDRRHEQACSDCDKVFVFSTSIHYHYEAWRADCLNEGGEHKLEMSTTYPGRYSRMQCEDCDYIRNPTPEEFAAAGIVIEQPAAETRDCQCATYCMELRGMKSDPPMNCRGLPAMNTKGDL